MGVCSPNSRTCAFLKYRLTLYTIHTFYVFVLYVLFAARFLFERVMNKNEYNRGEIKNKKGKKYRPEMGYKYIYVDCYFGERKNLNARAKIHKKCFKCVEGVVCWCKMYYVNSIFFHFFLADRISVRVVYV